jgi:predicted DNA binding protein
VTRPRRAAPEVPMIEARLSLKIPETFGLGKFMVDHPELVLEGRDRSIPDPRHIVVEIQIRGGEERDWSSELRSAPGVILVQRLTRFGKPNIYRISWKAPVTNTALLQRFDLVGALRMILSGGRASLSIALPKRKLMTLVDQLRHRGLEPDILEMRPLRGAVPRGGLTPKQRVRFQAAVEAGYFEIPRRVTLEEMARRYSVPKSAFWESLAQARRKILISAGRALAGEDDPTEAELPGMT